MRWGTQPRWLQRLLAHRRLANGAHAVALAGIELGLRVLVYTPPALFRFGATAFDRTALALYMGSSTREVLRCLLEGLRWLWGAEAVKVAGKSGISQARGRLGEAPLRRLYEELVHPVATRATKGAWYRDWRLVSLDGSCLDVADTEANRAEFGGPKASRGESAPDQYAHHRYAEHGDQLAEEHRIEGHGGSQHLDHLVRFLLDEVGQEHAGQQQGQHEDQHLARAGKAVADSTLPAATQHLVEIRASQINGCGFCIDMHTKDAAHAGESAVRLNLVAAWREATVFTEAERAALELAEQGTRIADAAGLPARTVDVLVRLWDVLVREDALLVEVNPLVSTRDGQIVALDGKVTLDDNARFRQARWGDEAEAGHDPLEAAAAAKGLNYVKLDGEVGIIGNGAGLVMSTLDVVAGCGARPANFLDIGGGASAQVMADGLSVVLSDPAVRSVFVNVFGGITACDAVADGIVRALDTVRLTKPLVVRLDGNNAQRGRALLDERAHPLVEQVTTMDGAASRAAHLATTP